MAGSHAGIPQKSSIFFQSSAGESDDRAEMLDSKACAEVTEMIAAMIAETDVKRIAEFLPCVDSMSNRQSNVQR